MTRVVKNVQKSTQSRGVPDWANKRGHNKSESKCQNAKKPPKTSEKAGSVHDLRRCAVSSLLRVPPQYTTFNQPRKGLLKIWTKYLKLLST